MKILDSVMRGVGALVALVGKMALCGESQQALDKINELIERGGLTEGQRKELEQRGNSLWESMGTLGCAR